MLLLLASRELYTWFEMSNDGLAWYMNSIWASEAVELDVDTPQMTTLTMLRDMVT